MYLFVFDCVEMTRWIDFQNRLLNIRKSSKHFLLRCDWLVYPLPANQNAGDVFYGNTEVEKEANFHFSFTVRKQNYSETNEPIQDF